MRVLIIGGSSVAEETRAALFERLDALELEGGVQIVLHDGAPGAGDAADAWARSRIVPQRAYIGRGPLVAARRLLDGRPDLVLALPGAAPDELARCTVAGVAVERIGPEEAA